MVTAAGYPGKPERYAARFRGLLDKMKELKCPKEVGRGGFGGGGGGGGPAWLHRNGLSCASC